ncbi:MAG: redoxin domain-containing protein, partial [bacterium]
MAETTRRSTFGGDPVTLLGPELRPGDRAPRFDLVGVDGSPVTLASSRGRTRIVLSILSVDTNVCHAEIREIARRVAEMDGVEVLVVSTDLPFAMKRWIEAVGVENVTMASDHREASFGLAWGTLVEGRR